MALKFIEGFGQFQGQLGSRLLSSLSNAGYTMQSGVSLQPGRHPGSHAVELRVSPGDAGVTWSRRTNGSTTDFNGVGYGAGRWVAVGNSGVIYSSLDTISWTPGLNITPITLYAVAYGNGRWVAVGGNNASVVLITSLDGVTWDRIPLTSAGTLRDVHYANGRWVAVGYASGASLVVTSDDGEVWGYVDVGGSQQLNTVTHNQPHGWVIGGSGGRVLFSPDGLIWTAGAYGSSNSIQAIAGDGDGLLVAIGGNAPRLSSNGGSSWVSAPSVGALNSRSLAYADGLWVAVGTQGDIMTTRNPDTGPWVRRNASGFSNIFMDVAASSGQDAAWVAVGQTYGNPPNNTGAVYVSSGPPTEFKRTFNTSAQRFTIGFAHMANTRGRIVSIADVCDLDWPVALEILGEQGTAIPIRNAWYYYELTIDKTAETITLHVNDTLDMQVPLPAGVAAMTSFEVSWQVENGATAWLSDIYLVDSSTAGSATLVSRLGPVRIPVRFPTSDELTEWDSTESGEHWEVVGIPPPDSERFIHSATSGDQDLFMSSEPLPDGAGTEAMPIIAVGMVALAQKSDLDNRHLGMVIGAGAEQVEQVEEGLTIDPKYSYTIFERAPGGTAWTAEDIIEEPFGVVVRP